MFLFSRRMGIGAIWQTKVGCYPHSHSPPGLLLLRIHLLRLGVLPRAWIFFGQRLMQLLLQPVNQSKAPALPVVAQKCCAG